MFFVEIVHAKTLVYIPVPNCGNPSQFALTLRFYFLSWNEILYFMQGKEILWFQWVSIWQGLVHFPVKKEHPRAQMIAPSTPLSSALPMCRASQQKAAFTVPLRARLEKATKPRAPGILQLQKACQGQGHCPNIAPFTSFCLAPPMCLAPQQKAAVFLDLPSCL